MASMERRRYLKVVIRIVMYEFCKISKNKSLSECSLTSRVLYNYLHTDYLHFSTNVMYEFCRISKNKSVNALYPIVCCTITNI